MDNVLHIQLNDLMENYPSAMTPQIQTILSSKEEFREVGSVKREKLPEGRGSFFKHQIAYQRFLRTYDALVDIDEPGTGKSCSVFGYTELVYNAYRNALEGLPHDPKLSHIKRSIVLVKRPAQETELRNQLVCKCSDGKYESAGTAGSDKDKARKTAITKEISKFYKVFNFKILQQTVIS